MEFKGTNFTQVRFSHHIPKDVSVFPHYEKVFDTKVLRNTEQLTIVGLRFTWFLEIYSKKELFFEYECFEDFVDGTISIANEKDIWGMVIKSY